MRPMTTTLKSPSYLASLPGTLDSEAALRHAATMYDDAAANRAMSLARDLRAELAGMQNPSRAADVFVSVLAELLGVPWQTAQRLFYDGPSA